MCYSQQKKKKMYAKLTVCLILTSNKITTLDNHAYTIVTNVAI